MGYLPRCLGSLAKSTAPVLIREDGSISRQRSRGFVKIKKKKKKSVFAEGARLRTRKESEKKKRWVDSVSLGFDSEFGL
jgi:hypothetical protein